MGLSHADRLGHGLPSGLLARSVPVALALTVVALQIVYPLVAQGPARDRLTVIIVLVFAAASLVHALVWRGAVFGIALFTTTALGGLAVEVVGVSTGWPFGEYHYLDSLGAQLLGVPLVVALAWMMMAYPAYVVADVIGGGRVRRALVGGWALASWDLFLDPQMVQAGHWEWRGAEVALAGIPVSNYIAWFAVASVMMAALRALTSVGAVVGPGVGGRSGVGGADAASGRGGTGARVGAGAAAGSGTRIRSGSVVAAGDPVRPGTALGPDDRAPLALYLWTWASSVMAHAVFFGLPTSAVVGGIGMGVIVGAAARAYR